MVALRPDATAAFDGAVRAVVYAGGTVYVGGDFTRAYAGGRAHAREHLAALDARSGTLLPWHPVADGPVYALAAATGTVFAGGEFARVNDEERAYLAALDAATGDLDARFDHTVDGPVHAAAVGHGRLYVAGEVHRVDGGRRGGAAAFDLSDGRLLDDWRPRANGRVHAVAVAPDRVFLGGAFTELNGTGTRFLAVVDPYSGELETGFRADPRAAVHGIAVADRGVYVATAGTGGRGFAFGPDGARRWTFATDGDIQAVVVVGAMVLFGGHFDHACRTGRTGERGRCVDGTQTRVKLAAAAVTDGRLLPWRADANGVTGVLAMTVDLSVGKLSVGGLFTAIGGAPQRRFAQFSLG
ncbi:hypothetical protein ACFQX7_19520 [Luedemannella flava]